MYNFIICEDNPNTGAIIKGFIDAYATREKLDYHIQVYQDQFEQVIEFAESNLGHINIYFLDIILNHENMTGLTLARQIRRIDVMAYFLFITSHPELSLKVFQYKLKALDYIYKQDENIQKRIDECLDTITREMTQLGNVDVTRQITLKSNQDFFTVKLHDILYFETRPGSRMLYCVLKDGTDIEFYATMKAVMKQLDSRFFQCHRSFIINTRQVKKLGRGERYYSVIMNNGKECDVAKQKWKDLVKHVRA